jgi:LIM domain-containing protein 2
MTHCYLDESQSITYFYSFLSRQFPLYDINTRYLFFVLRKNKMPLCARCDHVIDDAKFVEWNNREYHEKCFQCFDCQRSLKNKMVYTDEQFFCSICIKNKNRNEKIISRCFRCQKNFLSNTSYTEFDGKYYHESCFTCSSCNKSIIEKQFYPNKNRLLCEICYETTLDKCELCEKTINKGHIIIFQDKKYHDTCMRCAKCNGDIGGKMCFTKTKDGSFICRVCEESEK